VGTSILRTQHTSLQFSDSLAQQKHDVRSLFANGVLYPIKTGTESGNDNALNDLVKAEAAEFNHIVHFFRGNWVAIDRKIIKPGSVKKGSVFVAKASDVVGPGHDSGFATVAFDHVDPRIGRVNQAAAHYPTKGSRPGDPNYKITKKYAEEISKWMAKVGAGSDLAFVNGDFNMDDAKLDWAHGGNFTSMGDELKKHPNTGHGPIDGFASYDKDGRVKANGYRVLNDTQRKMFSDHFVCIGAWEITHLKGK